VRNLTDLSNKISQINNVSSSLETRAIGLQAMAECSMDAYSHVRESMRKIQEVEDVMQAFDTALRKVHAISASGEGAIPWRAPSTSSFMSSGLMAITPIRQPSATTSRGMPSSKRMGRHNRRTLPESPTEPVIEPLDLKASKSPA
jgi:hypothetical protein